jgi:hypothetical protein
MDYAKVGNLGVRLTEAADSAADDEEIRAIAKAIITATQTRSRCDASAKKGTGTGVCDAALDDLGQCLYARNHIDV